MAASVALIAIFGLQFGPGVESPVDVAADNAVADGVDASGYIVPPRPVDDELRQYVLSHGASASELGAKSMNTRLVTLRLSEEALDAEEKEDEDTDDLSADEIPAQP